MSQALQRVETHAGSPGAGGFRPATGARTPRDGGETGGPHRTGRAPDSRDGRAPGRGPGPPDCAAGPAPESPDTTACGSQRSGTAPLAPRHGETPGPAEPLGQ